MSKIGYKCKTVILMKFLKVIKIIYELFSQLHYVICLILKEFIFWSNVCDAEYKQNGDLVVMDFPVTLLTIVEYKLLQ